MEKFGFDGLWIRVVPTWAGVLDSEFGELIHGVFDGVVKRRFRARSPCAPESTSLVVHGEGWPWLVL